MVNIYSWNVNGIRACLNKGFLNFVDEYNPDIICLQETKAHPEQVDMVMQDKGYEYEYWNSAEKKGYSGVAIFSKIKPINVSHGIDTLELSDSEGRVITCEFEKFYLVTVYTPNSKRDLARLDYRYEQWDIKFLEYIKKLEQNKPVVFCGDLNVAHTEMDIRNPGSNKTTSTKPGNAGFTDKERERFQNIVDSGIIDTFRYKYPDTEKYTWWSFMGGARSRNVGWRIDYFCVSNILKENIEDAQIHNEVMGSDHCPISLKLKI